MKSKASPQPIQSPTAEEVRASLERILERSNKARSDVVPPGWYTIRQAYEILKGKMPSNYSGAVLQLRSKLIRAKLNAKPFRILINGAVRPVQHFQIITGKPDSHLNPP